MLEILTLGTVETGGSPCFLVSQSSPLVKFQARENPISKKQGGHCQPGRSLQSILSTIKREKKKLETVKQLPPSLMI